MFVQYSVNKLALRFGFSNKNMLRFYVVLLYKNELKDNELNK